MIKLLVRSDSRETAWELERVRHNMWRVLTGSADQNESGHAGVYILVVMWEIDFEGKLLWTVNCVTINGVGTPFSISLSSTRQIETSWGSKKSQIIIEQERAQKWMDRDEDWSRFEWLRTVRQLRQRLWVPRGDQERWKSSYCWFQREWRVGNGKEKIGMGRNCTWLGVQVMNRGNEWMFKECECWFLLSISNVFTKIRKSGTAQEVKWLRPLIRKMARNENWSRFEWLITERISWLPWVKPRNRKEASHLIMEWKWRLKGWMENKCSKMSWYGRKN